VCAEPKQWECLPKPSLRCTVQLTYEGRSRVAEIASFPLPHGIHANNEFTITPDSEQVRATIVRDGYLRMMEAIGGAVLAKSCVRCIGQLERYNMEGATDTPADFSLLT